MTIASAKIAARGRERPRSGGSLVAAFRLRAFWPMRGEAAALRRFAMRMLLTAALALAGAPAPRAQPEARDAAALGAGGCDPGEIRIRFAHGRPASGHPIGETADRFAVAVNRELDGRVCVDVFAGGRLAADSGAVAAIAAGRAEMAAPPVAAFARLSPALGVFDLPFLFTNLDSGAWFQRSGAGQRLKRSVEGGELLGLAFWNAGMRQIAAGRPVLRPEDLNGVVVADAGGAMSGAALQRLGARSVAAAPEALGGALDRGSVQALEATWARLNGEGLALRLDGVTATDHALAAHLVVASRPFWDQLPLNDQLALSQILARVTAQSAESVRRLARRHRTEIEAAGAPIHSLSEADRAAWEAAFEPFWRSAAQRIGARLVDEALAARR